MITRLNICLLDENDHIIAKEEGNTTWEIDLKKDKKLLQNDHMRSEVVRIMEDQMKIDIEKGIISRLLDNVRGKK